MQKQSKHCYLLRIPERLWNEICQISENKGINIRATIINLVTEGIKVEKIREEEFKKSVRGLIAD